MKTSPRLASLSALLATTVCCCAHADVVTDWNQKAVEVVVADSTPATLASRNMAMVQVAVFEAVNAISRAHAPYRLRLAAERGASPDAAIAAAAHGVLLRLYPSRQAMLDSALDAALAAMPDTQARRDGRNVGELAAAGVLAMRANDGAAAVVPFAARSGPGLWVPPANIPALAPHWGSVMPWAMTRGAQFRPPAPPAIDSERQARDFDETYGIGGKNSALRTAEQTSVARVWIATGVPAWNPIARQLSIARGLSPEQGARLFALLAMATADAIIGCWDAKYTYHGWRPVAAIKGGGVPGRPVDPDWEPAVPTPPFPGYVSGHACFGGAAQVVLESVFGRGEIPVVTLITASAPGVTRSYNKLSSIVEEASNARIWGGIHWRADQEAGEELGRKVGQWVIDTQLRPAP